MGKKSPQVDEYIARAAAFAKPVLNHIRRTVHAACPQVEETIKWGMPHFVSQGILCSMAAFKAHCAFGFWHPEMRKALPGKVTNAMSYFGQIKSVADLPNRTALSSLVKQAAALNASGQKPVRKRPPAKAPARPPADLFAALKRNAKARAGFAALSPSHQREYIDWITEAKREETREKRLATTLEWLSKGKPRHWKYQR